MDRNKWVVGHILQVIFIDAATSSWLEGGGGSIIMTMRKVWGQEDPTRLAKLVMELVMVVADAKVSGVGLGVAHLLPLVIRYFSNP